MSWYAFHLGQIISTVLEQVDHGGQYGNAARTRIRDETSQTKHTQKRRFCNGAICRNIIALAIMARGTGQNYICQNIYNSSVKYNTTFQIYKELL